MPAGAWRMTDTDPLAPHPQCGADNEEGKAKKCNCYCHKGHNRHYWEAITSKDNTPLIKDEGTPEETWYIIERCLYCPDLKLKILRTHWKGPAHKIATFEYIIRGKRMVLTAEDWTSYTPKDVEPELKRIIDQKGKG